MPVVVRSHRRLVLVLAALAVVLGLGALAATGGLVVALALQAAGLGTADVGERADPTRKLPWGWGQPRAAPRPRTAARPSALRGA